MATRKTASGYQILYYDAGGRFRKRTFKGATRAEALRLEREILVQRDRGEVRPHPRQSPTLAAFAALWLEEGRAGWKLSTVQQYDQVLKSQLLPTFADHRLSSMTESEVRQWLGRLQDAGLSARRINLALLVLKMILRTARRRHLLLDDPVIAVRMLKEQQAEIDPLDPDEVTGFLKACPSWWRPYFMVAFWTGARPNELAALKRGDVDGISGTFRVRAGRYRGVESAPKTASSVRDVDLLPPVVDALKTQMAQQATARLRCGEGAPESGEDYAFTGPEGGLLNMNYLREKVWYPALTKAGLRRRTMYQTRHTFASNALAAGENPAWVSRMLGHSSPEMLFRVYARYIPNRTRRDGSAFHGRMEITGKGSGYTSTTPDLLPSERAEANFTKQYGKLEKIGAEGGT